MHWISCVSVCAYVSVHWISLREVWLFFTLLHQVFIYTDKIPPSLLQTEQSLLSQSLLTCQDVNNLHDPLQDLLQYAYVAFLLRSSEQDPELQMWPHWFWVKGENHLSQPPGNVLPNGAWEAVGLLCYNAALLASVQFVVYQDPQVLLCKDALQLFRPSMYSHMALFLPRCRTLHFPLLNFLRLLLAHFSSLSRFLWTAEK